MKRRSLLFLGALTPIALFTSRYLCVRAPNASRPMDILRCAEELNQLAATIYTPADSRRFVDYLADLFSENAPSAWTRSSFRRWIAQAEFSAVTDPETAIPEPRLAEAWNGYIETLGAPEDQMVTPAELHNLRDAFLATDRFDWNSAYRTIWTVPSIYATQPDGHLAPRCRAVESIRVLWDLAHKPDNLRAARDRVSKGVLTSDLYRKLSESSETFVRRGSISVSVRRPYPIELAQRNYIQTNGTKAFSDAVMTMLTKTLS